MSQLPIATDASDDHENSPEDSTADISNFVASIETMCDSLFTQIISMILPSSSSFTTESIKDVLKLCYTFSYYEKNLIAVIEKEIELRLKSLHKPSIFKINGDDLENGILVDLERSQLIVNRRLALELGWCKGLIRMIERKKIVE